MPEIDRREDLIYGGVLKKIYGEEGKAYFYFEDGDIVKISLHSRGDNEPYFSIEEKHTEQELLSSNFYIAYKLGIISERRYNELEEQKKKDYLNKKGEEEIATLKYLKEKYKDVIC